MFALVTGLASGNAEFPMIPVNILALNLPKGSLQISRLDK